MGPSYVSDKDGIKMKEKKMEKKEKRWKKVGLIYVSDKDGIGMKEKKMGKKKKDGRRWG